MSGKWKIFWDNLGVKRNGFGSWVLRLGAWETASGCLGFFAIVMRFRYLGAELVGAWAYFLALSAIPTAFYGNFNQALIRFLPTAKKADRRSLYSASLTFQVVVLAILLLVSGSIFLLFPDARFWEEKERVAGYTLGFLFPCASALIPIVMANSFGTAILNARERYNAMQILRVSELTAVNLAVLVVIFVIKDRIVGFFAICLLTIGISALMASVTSVIAWKEWAKEEKFTKGSFRTEMMRVAKEYFRGYTLPLQISSIFAFLKEYFGVLLLGQSGNMGDAGIISVANRMFRTPRKFIPNLINILFPRLVTSQARDADDFRSKYNSLYWGHFSFQTLLGLSILSLFPILTRIFNLPPTEALLCVLYLYALNLMISSMAQNYANLILLKKKTTWLLVTSLVRSLVVVLFNAWLVPLHGAIGAAMALVFSSVVSTAFLFFESRRSGIFSKRQFALQWIFCVAASLILTLPMLAYRENFSLNWLGF